MDAGTAALLAAAGFGAGAVNAVAGGGSLISFPALLAAGYPSVAANVTNSVALLPGYLGGSLAYRAELAGQRERIRALAPTATVGAAAGAALLLVSPASLFEAIVPWLILAACLLLALQPRAATLAQPESDEGRGWLGFVGRASVDRPRIRRVGPFGERPIRAGEALTESRRREIRRIRAQQHTRDDGRAGAALHVGLFVATLYGGYFGAGLGIVLLALLGVLLPDGIQRLNALKGLLSLLVAAVSAVGFVIFGPVAWDAALIVGAACLFGGVAGARVAQRLPAPLLRGAVIAFGIAVAIAIMM